MNESTITLGDRLAQVQNHIAAAMKLLDEAVVATIPTEGLGSGVVGTLSRMHAHLRGAESDLKCFEHNRA